MKRRYMLIAVAIIGIISWSQTINATEIILPGTGVIDYGTYRKDVTFSGNVNLDYVYSSIDEDAMTIELWEPYNSTTNTVRYMFTSEAYYPEYWEHLDQEPFIYQDNNSGDLYILYINMSEIEIPEDPWKTGYINLSRNYNETWNELNITIHNLTTARENLELFISLYENASYELNITSEEKGILEDLLFTKIGKIAGLESDLNDTKITRDNAMANATVYRRFFNEMNSYKADFSFKLGGESDSYTTIYEYEITEERLENQIAGFPIILIFSIAVTMTLSFMIGYWKWSSKRSTSEEVEIKQGVDPTVTLVNKIKARIPIKPKSVKVIEPEISTDEKYVTMKKEVDSRMNVIETKVDANRDDANSKHDDVIEKLNILLSGKPEPSKKVIP